MAEKSEDIRTTVSVRVLFKLAALVAAVLAGVSGPSLYVANAYSNQQWVSHVEFEKLEKRVDDGLARSDGSQRLLRIVICEQRHGKDGWDNVTNKCKTDLGLD